MIHCQPDAGQLSSVTGMVNAPWSVGLNLWLIEAVDQVVSRLLYLYFILMPSRLKVCIAAEINLLSLIAGKMAWFNPFSLWLGGGKLSSQHILVQKLKILHFFLLNIHISLCLSHNFMSQELCVLL